MKEVGRLSRTSQPRASPLAARPLAKFLFDSENFEKLFRYFRTVFPGGTASFLGKRVWRGDAFGRWLAAVALNGKVYAIGGEGEAGESLDAVEEYDCATNRRDALSRVLKMVSGAG